MPSMNPFFHTAGLSSLLLVLATAPLSASLPTGAHPLAGVASKTDVWGSVVSWCESSPASVVPNRSAATDDVATGAATSPDGRTVYVTGRSGGRGDTDAVTVAYDAATGRRLWRAVDDAPLGRAQGYNVAAGERGDLVFVTGWATPGGVTKVFTAAHRAADGAPVWNRTEPNIPGAERFTLGTGADGALVIVSIAAPDPDTANTWADIRTIAYHAATGATAWDRTYAGTPRGADQPQDLAMSPDGRRVFVVGGSQGRATGMDFVALAYDAATGAELWTARLDEGSVHEVAEAAAVTPDGATLLVTGYSQRGPGAGGKDYVTAAYDAATGAPRWTARLDGGGVRDDIPFALAVRPQGDLVVATGGAETDGSDSDYLTVAYRVDDGSQAWAARHAGSDAGHSRAMAAAFPPDGAHVVVTGCSMGPRGNYDLATVGYEAATGAERWVRRVDAGGDDTPWNRGLVTSAATGLVTVAARSEAAAAGTGHDYLTVAYDAATGRSAWSARDDFTPRGR